LPFCHVTLKGQRPLPSTYPPHLKTLGDHLRKQRLDLGLLQKEVAKELGVSKSTITSWERKRAAPALWQIPRIIVFLRNSPLPQASIAEQLVMLRKHLGISQKRLAWTLGIDPGTLARWEAGSNTPNPAVMAYLEKLSADDL